MVDIAEKSTTLKRRKNLWFKRYFGSAKGNIAFNLTNYFFFLIVSTIMLYPFLYVLVTSLKGYTFIDGAARTFLTFEAYGLILSKIELVRAFFFTLFIVAISIVVRLAVTMMTAYALSKGNLLGRKSIMLFIVFSMLFSGGLIPYYLLIAKELNMMDTIWVYILPDIASGFVVIISMNFIRSLPDSIEEAATIDGADYFQVFIRIILPLSVPIMATIGLWIGVGVWNSWYTTTLFIRDQRLVLFQNILKTILSGASATTGSVGSSDLLTLDENSKMAAIVIGILPILVVYPFVQRHFVKGVLLGSVKG